VSEPERHQGAQGEAECDGERHASEGQGDIFHGVLQCAPVRGVGSVGG
jgi:hypothetical protein